MRDAELREEEVGHDWRIRLSPGARAVRVPVTASDHLRRVPVPGRNGCWEIIGDRPGFALDLKGSCGLLAAGWYALRGRLDVTSGRLELASVRLHYASHSALTDVELVLSGPVASGRISTVMLFMEPVEALEFKPGMAHARFRMRDFGVYRISRLAALRAMLNGRHATPLTDLARRLFAWAKATRKFGVKRATDALYVDYRKRTRPQGITEYDLWVRKYDIVDALSLQDFEQRARALDERGPMISVLLTVNNTREPWLRQCLDVMLAQVWKRWELCVADNLTPLAPHLKAVLEEYASRDARVRVARGESGDDISGARNAALGMARGEIVVLLDQDDVLRPHVLLRLAEAAVGDPELAIIYSDEDKIDSADNRFDPDFKPDWNPDLFRSRNYMGHLVAIRTTLMREAGGFRAGFNGDYDLLLRCTETLKSRQIGHIPEILCHRRPKTSPTTSDDHEDAASGARALAEHVKRIGSAGAVVTEGLPPGFYRIRWPLPQPAPRISLIIPTRDRAGLLRTCVESILAKSTYPDFELVVVDNQSGDRAALDYLDELAAREHVRVLRYDAPFNYSAINNWAARQCSGQLLALVNNDIEVISPDWLEEMAGFAVRPDTGAVGAMLYYPDDTIQHAGMLLGIHGAAGHVYAGKPRGYCGYMRRALLSQNLSAVTGACLLVRREAFEEAGGLDEQLPVEFNDVDFCLRLCQRGYRNVWTPFAELYHNESASRAVGGAAAARTRFDEVELMRQRWGDLLRDDPAYNPNLSLHGLECSLAFPPRRRRGRHRGIGYDDRRA